MARVMPTLWNITMRPLLRPGMIALVVTLPLAVSAFALDVPSDPEAFTGYAEAKLQPEISTVPVSTTGILTVRIGPITDNLHQLYDTCQAKPDGCEAAIHQHAQDIKQVLGIKR
jgi:hypothetical protein